MTLGSNNDKLMSEINVTPFVDVMLVLLIIFMVTAPMMVQGVNVSLPQTKSGALPADEQHLVITIDRKQDIFINNLRVDIDFLQEKLIKLLQGRENREVFLKADKTIPYGIVVHIMAEIKGAGVEKLGMITAPLEDKKKNNLQKEKS